MIWALRAIELYSAIWRTNASDETIQSMKDKTAALGIKITSIGVTAFTKNHDANRRIFEFAKKAGLPKHFGRSFRRFLRQPRQARGGIWHSHCHSQPRPQRAIQQSGRRAQCHQRSPQGYRRCADLGHYIRSAEDPVKAIHLLEGRLYGIHLKDFSEQKANAKGVILGQGCLDVEGVFKALKHVNFPADGYISLEYEEKPDDPIADIQQCLAVASAAAAQKSPRAELLRKSNVALISAR